MANPLGTCIELPHRPAFRAAAALPPPPPPPSAPPPRPVSTAAAEVPPAPVAEAQTEEAASREAARAVPRRAFARVAKILAEQEEGLTLKELCAVLHMQSEALRRVLAAALVAGRVRRSGARRHTRYLLNP